MKKSIVLMIACFILSASPVTAGPLSDSHDRITRSINDLCKPSEVKIPELVVACTIGEEFKKIKCNEDVSAENNICLAEKLSASKLFLRALERAIQALQNIPQPKDDSI